MTTDTTTEMTFEQRVAAHQTHTAARAKMGHIGADSIDFTDGFVSVEVRGDGDEPGTVWHAEVVLDKKSTSYAIWALAKSIGYPDEAEAMLKAVGLEF